MLVEIQMFIFYVLIYSYFFYHDCIFINFYSNAAHKFPVYGTIKLYCIVLYCIVLYCIVLYCIVLYCIVLYCIVLYCIVLYCIVVPHPHNNWLRQVPAQHEPDGTVAISVV